MQLPGVRNSDHPIVSAHDGEHIFVAVTATLFRESPFSRHAVASVLKRAEISSMRAMRFAEQTIGAAIYARSAVACRLWHADASLPSFKHHPVIFEQPVAYTRCGYQFSVQSSFLASSVCNSRLDFTRFASSLMIRPGHERLTKKGDAPFISRSEWAQLFNS